MTQIVLIWALFICAQFADVWTTNKVLSQGGRELNGVVVRIMLAVGLITAAVAANNFGQIK